MRSFARAALSLAAGLVFAAHARATWSIVVVDHATGEVGIVGATCIENIQVQRYIAVVAVGKGAGAAQYVVDPTTQNRRRMFRRLGEGWSPEEILADLATLPSWATSQYGIASFAGPAQFRNTGQPAFLGVAGETGTIRYSIQGNVLAGDSVVLEAERAFLDSTGDLGQRLMAAMEAAGAQGGDGRCSCDEDMPTSCGAPPPNFTKSAHTAFVLVARIGDRDGDCDDLGCATGSYYLNRKARGDWADPDPLLVLRERYDEWRMNRIGVVDGILSEVQPAATRMPADGTTTVGVTVRMRDVDGNPLAFGGFPVYVRGVGGPQAASVDAVVDNGDGTYTITLRAGTAPGHCRWRIVADQVVPRTLHPLLELDVDPVAPLHAGWSEVSASAAPEVPLVLNAGIADAGRNYLVLASASGTQPGTPFGGQTLPLNTDRLLRFTLAHPGPPTLPGSSGQLDALGRAQAALRPRPEMLAPFVGGRFDFSAILFGSPNAFTDPVGFDIVP